MNFTESQQEAIDHRDGNLKIIACAGSGKTSVMSERIAKLVSEGIDRDKIVAFTFTEKAADSLKFRIREALLRYCPDAPHLGSMYVGTIHSFAFQKLRDLIPAYRSYDVLDQVRRIIWTKKHSDDLSAGTDIRLNNFRIVEQFLRTADIIRDNQISDSALDNIPEFKSCYDEFLSLLDKDQYLDYSGMLHILVQTLENNSSILEKLRDEVSYLVVDEYQDINSIQEKLISLISGSDGNLCVVGDDDQSIFEFQGADVSNIIDFEERYDDVKIVKLEDNFRCPEQVISAAKDLIRRNTLRIEKSMKPGNVDGVVKTSQPGDVYKVEFDTIEEEVEFIVNKINELRGVEYDDDGDLRGLDYGDMAIIVRGRLSVNRLIEPLKRAGIRFAFGGGTGALFQRPEVNFIRILFCYFADKPSEYRGRIVTLEHLKATFEELSLSHLQWEDAEERITELKEYIKSIESGNPDSSRRRIFLQDFFYEALKLLKVGKENFAEDVMYDLGALSKLVADFEYVHGWINNYYFNEFVYFINAYAHEKTDEGGLEDTRSSNSVSILTTHRAKGLEFPVVFIPDISTGRFPSRMRTRKPVTFLNESIFDLQKYCSRDEGERRLFYVASTRTKKFLFLSRSSVSDTGNNASRSIYITQFDHEIMLLDDVSDPTVRVKVPPKCKPHMELMPTSFSDIKFYIACPYNYLLQQIMGFSPVLNLQYGYGLQVHNLLNHFHKKWETEPPTFEEIEAMVESDFFLRFTRGVPFENMKGKAKELLCTYVKEYGDEFPLKLDTEKPFELILEGALISGSIDLIQKIDPESSEVKDVSIVDFKTEKEALETKKFIRLQLRLYALATHKSLGLSPKVANIHYLTDNFRYEVDISDERLEETRDQISEVVQKIKDSKFEPCPGGHCASCDVSHVCSSRE